MSDVEETIAIRKMLNSKCCTAMVEKEKKVLVNINPFIIAFCFD